MAEPATILIPDISGYTEFVTRTELDHSTQIISDLLDAIVESMPGDFVVSEIEGDAVLLYKKGPPPTKKEIIEQCIKTFRVFHAAIRQEWENSLCQCGACQSVVNLTLKFIVHFGNIAESKVAQFMRASGADMVIAHRLLKNSLNQHEYVLTTDAYLKNVPDSNEAGDLSWMPAKEEYPSLGIIAYHFASLTSVKQVFPEIEPMETAAISLDGLDVVEERIEINVPRFDVHEAILNTDKRRKWVEGLKSGEGPDYLNVGSKYVCVFDDAKLVIEPRHVGSTGDEIIYEEFATDTEANYYTIYHFDIKAIDKNRTVISLSVFPQTGHSFSAPLKEVISGSIKVNLENLKAFLEGEANK